MFAVPGWSVATEIKAENLGARAAGEGKSKKRKRAAADGPGAVNAENLETLWERVIEGKKPRRGKGKGEDGHTKRRKRGKKADGGGEAQAEGADVASGDKAEQKPQGDKAEEKQPGDKPEKQSQGDKPEEKQPGDKPEKQSQGDKPEKKQPGNKPEEKQQGDKPKNKQQGDKPENKQQGDKKPEGEVAAEPQAGKKKRNRKNKGDEKQQPAPGTDPATKEPQQQSAAAAKKQPLPATARPAPAKLTPLQSAMRAKLVPARFRHLNETLYTRPSDEAFKLFSDSPEMFDEYHAGFRQQVNVWPENPVDEYIKAIQERGAVGSPRDNSYRGDRRQGKGSARSSKPEQQQQQPGGAVAALPRTRGVCTIADLGCGDAQLSTVLEPEKAKLRLEVLSYDLQSPHPLVTRADIAALPAEDGAVNVAIFCLALMGTNWLDFVDEAYRVLHWKGELWVAEIKSRFSRKRPARGAPVAHSVGNRKKSAVPAAAAAAPADFSQDLAVEVDGQEDKRNETDVTAFVEALKKRGFVLRGEGTSEVEGAVDLSNRMFVKMYFVKAAAPSAGKNAVEDKGAAGAGAGGRGTGRPARGSHAAGEAKEEVDENKILKPCVYKLR